MGIPIHVVGFLSYKFVTERSFGKRRDTVCVLI